MTGKGNNGWTVVEMMLVVVVTGLLLGIGVPSWRHLTEDARLRSAVTTYQQALHTARHLAVGSGRNVTLCALDGKGRCSGSWGAELTLFHDDTGKGVMAAEKDRLMVAVLPEDAATLQVSWRGFGQRTHLTARPSGHWRQNGRFLFCLGGPHPQGRSIVINAMGRQRVESAACPAPG